MPSEISFITANFVAREIGYSMSDWGEGDRATQEYFRPIATYPDRIGAMLDDVVAMRFDTIDLWGAHLHCDWATDEHIDAANSAIAERELTVSGMAAFCTTLELLEGFSKLAASVGAPTIEGGSGLFTTDRAEALAVLTHYDVTFAIENHPEKTPVEVLEVIGDGADGRLGAASDTGWWATQGYAPADSIRDFGDHLFAVHLKDIRAEGGHDTCRLGDGVADIEECVRALGEVGYSRAIGIEHEPEAYDPRPEIVESRAMLESWLAA